MESTLQPSKDLFKAVFGMTREKVRQLVYDSGADKETKISSQKVFQGLEHHLQVSPGEATELVGWTATRKSRNTTLDRNALDRAYTTLEVYNRVTKFLGNKAVDWFRQPNKHLENRSPMEVLETRAGYSELNDLLDAIESGNYL